MLKYGSKRIFCTMFLSAASLAASTLRLNVLPQNVRPNPIGGIVAADRTANEAPAQSISLTVPRKAYASFHLVASASPTAKFRLAEVAFPAKTGVQVDVFREWFHYVPAAKQYFPDALIPVHLPHMFAVADVENQIPGQSAQAFWVDLWIPGSVTPGNYKTKFVLSSGSKSSSVLIRLRVLAATVPDDDAVVMDHNSYGTGWFSDQYPRLAERVGPNFLESPDADRLIHAYHRIFYEHRGTFHQLGYGHAGKVSPSFAPVLAGDGKNRHIIDWTRFDRHYRPLLDGSAFVSSRRGAKPIPFTYLPVNPEWPASYEHWGEAGYEREFSNVLAEMDQHFRERGWTNTRFEMFFNHKKRYKGFDWDGDEQRFAGDYEYLKVYRRLLNTAIPHSPVRYVFRADVSWTMEQQWNELAGVINFWVCGGGMFSWYPQAPALLRSRGDIIWTYGGTPSVAKPSSYIALDVARAWIQGVDGFVRWLTTSPGPDPWFHFAGGEEALVYPGDRFGIDGPIPSIRLKLERNAVQDVALLNSLAHTAEARLRLADGLAQAFNHTKAKDWWSLRPRLADTAAEDWSNADIDDASVIDKRFSESLSADAWQNAQAFIYGLCR